jgi:DNA-directed RNA polymerase subunit RPC12/RpoP
MERLMQIIRITRDPNANKDLLLSSKIKVNAGTAQESVNFCIKCFKGHFIVQYSGKKGWGIKCDSCGFNVPCLTGAGLVRVEKETCPDCESRMIFAQYKDKSPFPGNALTRTGCLLCDTVMRSTIVNVFFK